MKQTIKSLTLVAVATLGLTACQNDLEEQVGAEQSVVINFVADTANSRTSVDTSGAQPIFEWGANENFVVLEQTTSLSEASAVSYQKVEGKAHITSEFPTNAGEQEYQYVTIYPAEGYVGAESIEAARLTLPAEQTMAEGSYDPNADLMVSRPVTTEVQPTEAQLVSFTRLAAVAKMSLQNFVLEEGDQVERVIFTAEGKSLAGQVSANLRAPHDFTIDTESASGSVSVATTSTGDIYFTLLPTTLEAGDSYAITIVTDNYLYMKRGAIAEGKALEFQAGMVTRFGVDMEGIVAGDKWKLVEDASMLAEGDIVAIAASEYDYILGCKSISNYPYASYTEVVRAGDYLYHPSATAESEAKNIVQPFTLMQRDGSKVAFDLYNGVDYTNDENTGFVYASTDKTLKTQAYPTNNSLFYVTITDGVASIVAKDGDTDYKQLSYFHTSYASTRKFCCIAEADMTDNASLCLYRLEGGVGEIPLIAANITTPEEVTILGEETTVAKVIGDVVFNYVGKWAISVTANAEWIDLAYDAANNCLTYTAEANHSSAREATVTITATHEGAENLSWSFTLIQDSAPVEVSIAEFIEKAKDLTITYKLTGRLSSLAASKTGTYTIEDENGNQAKIKNLYAKDGQAVYGNIDLRVGDVITVYTIVTGLQGQGGALSYPSTYEGYYRVAATATQEAPYSGGEVAVDVTTSSSGNVALPEAVVEGTMAECDYASFAYAGGDSATVTFDENGGSAREATLTFTYGLAKTTIVVTQQANP